MKLKTLLVLSFVAAALGCATSAFAEGCQLGPEDYQALAQSPSGLNEATFATASPGVVKNACLARSLVKKARSGGSGIANQLTPDDIPVGLSKYTTSDEYQIVSPIATRVMAAAMRRKGMVA
jgi:hypothetical protein